MITSEGGGPSFESTPSWVIGAVVCVIVAISLAVEKLLHYLGQFLKRKNKKPLYDALKKIKEELMLIGFVSLLLAAFQDDIKRWCISEKVAQKWLPCRNDLTSNAVVHWQSGLSMYSSQGRHLLAQQAGCPKGKVPLISLGVLHHLHYLIFILAVTHVVTCTVTVLLGEVKISQWRKWEDSIKAKKLLNSDRQPKIIDIRSLTFIQGRYVSVDANKRNYVISFFKHLCGIVTKADYEAMRLGFILTHCNGNQMFNFQKYMVYAYESDFEKVVSISCFLWLFAVMALSLNVVGWHIYLWISVIPLALLLILGTKLQQVITELAIYIAQRHTVIIGDIRIQPSDDYFWFHRPRIVLVFIHAILFLNSFGFAVFFWTLFQFGFHSCVMGEPTFIYPRIAIMVAVQTICSYSTLPLYAIVTQMGSSYNEEAMERSGFRSSNQMVLEDSLVNAGAETSVQITGSQNN